MKKQHREMVATRRLYKLEDSLYSRREFRKITQQRSLPALRKLAYYIWKKERMKGKLPNIIFGKGVFHVKEYFSWCDGTTIELAPKQRDIMTMIHELIHAMGYDDHGEEFVNEYIDILVKYSPINEQIIIEAFSEL